MASLYILLITSQGNAVLRLSKKDVSRFAFLTVAIFIMCHVFSHIMSLLSFIIEYHNAGVLHLLLAFLFIFSRNGLFSFFILIVLRPIAQSKKMSSSTHRSSCHLPIPAMLLYHPVKFIAIMNSLFAIPLALAVFHDDDQRHLDTANSIMSLLSVIISFVYGFIGLSSYSHLRAMLASSSARLRHRDGSALTH